MENTKIREKSQFFGEVPGNVTVVEVDAADGADFGVVRCRSTINSSVVTHIRSNPISGEIEGI